MRRKKIVFYTMIMQKGGTEQTIANLSNIFIDNYDITIITNINRKSEYNLNKKIKHICIDSIDKSKENIIKKIFTKVSLQRSKKLKKIIETEQPDIIFTFLPEPTIRMLSLKKTFKNIPIIVSIRNHPKKEYCYPLLKFIRDYYYKKAAEIIIQDQKYNKYLSKRIQNKIEVIPNFISELFITKKENIKREKKIVTVTRLEQQKNVSLLIKSFSKLHHKFDEYKLYICGSGTQKEKIEKLIKKLKMDERIILLGNVKNIKKTIQNAALFVLPSNYEGMPNALLEAMSLSLPVISTNSTEVINSIIEHNVNGLISPKKNIYALTKNMEYILENQAKANSISKEAEKIKIKYNKEIIIKKWQLILEKHL